MASVGPDKFCVLSRLLLQKSFLHICGYDGCRQNKILGEVIQSQS
jgi:hypothetical protein